VCERVRERGRVCVSVAVWLWLCEGVYE